MAYFTQDYIDFFQDLARNNHKTWFHEHKKQYENVVKKPMLAFVEDLIANKQFYYLKHAAPEFFLQENILDVVLEHWLAAKPLNDFLSAS